MDRVAVDIARARSYVAVATPHLNAMRWTWDGRKNRENEKKHGLGFETAKLVFDDPYAATREDMHSPERRWQTIGVVENVTLLVVHTGDAMSPRGSDEVGRIISARKATAGERRAYEEGTHQG